MFKWMLTLAITVVVAAIYLPRLMQVMRRHRLPGDVTLRLRGREIYLPFATTLLLSLLAGLIARLL